MLRSLLRIIGIRKFQSRRLAEAKTLQFPPPEDLTDEELSILTRVKGLTMTSVERQISLCRILDYVIENKIGGDFVECGVWKGGSSMIAALKLLNSGIDKQLWMYDTFEGMPAPDNSVDLSHSDALASAILDRESDNKSTSYTWAIGSEEEVKRNVLSTGFNLERLKLIRGKVEDTIPDSGIPDEICILRLDTDWYSSTLHELIYLYPRVVSGGFIIIDDYGHWQGARMATDNYFDRLGARPYLHRVDYTCRIIQKT